MRPFLFSLLAAGVVFRGVTTTAAAERVFSSGPNRVSLLELYTSEGCSSCPPAERWLGSLREAPGLWRDFVPVAFHVNYWNELGWRDRFATKPFTQRQYAYAEKWRSRSVYTPCFIRDGAEWQRPSRPPSASQEPAGILKVVVDEQGRGRAEFTSEKPSRPRERLELHVAVLGNGVTSKVTAGENRGENLRHEFVALALSTFLGVAESESRQTVDFVIPRTTITDAPKTAAAFWITRAEDLAPLQATGGWLTP